MGAASVGAAEPRMSAAAGVNPGTPSNPILRKELLLTSFARPPYHELRIQQASSKPPGRQLRIKGKAQAFDLPSVKKTTYRNFSR